MDENMKKRNEILAKTVIKGLESRNMSGYYAADKEAAVKQALELIPEGSTIAMGGCASASEVGLISALEDGNYNYLDRSKMSPRESLMAAYNADVFLSSANARSMVLLNTPMRNVKWHTIPTAAPKAAPDEMPSTKGSAIGFLKMPWYPAPLTARAAPVMKPRIILGKRMFQMIVILPFEISSRLTLR